MPSDTTSQPGDRERFQREFARRRAQYLAAMVIAAPLLFVSVCLLKRPISVPLLILSFTLVIFALLIWRCPACTKWLPRVVGRYCPHCGVALK